MNVFEFALKMEIDGKAHYEELAAGTTVTGLKNIFLRLAADEQKHYDTFVAIRDKATVVMTDSTVIDEAKNVFQGLMTDKSVVGGLGKDLDGYRYAMKIEADSVRLYEDMATKEASPETTRLIRRIADEEKKHFNIMENLYDFVLAPQNYLAWGEFSNLKEF
jgi:rubrerythrin